MYFSQILRMGVNFSYTKMPKKLKCMRVMRTKGREKYSEEIR